MPVAYLALTRVTQNMHAYGFGRETLTIVGRDVYW